MATSGPKRRPEQERFVERIAYGEGCWDWLGCRKKQGYGMFFVWRNGAWKNVLAHRFSYELWVGRIPDGLHIDHLCENTSCVRPDHLEPVTAAENMRRWSERARSRTVCRNGHDVTVLGRTKEGKCKACVRERNKKMYSGAPPPGEHTHCPEGHPYEGANLRLVKGKNPGTVTRRCRTCDKRRFREWRQRRGNAQRRKTGETALGGVANEAAARSTR